MPRGLLRIGRALRGSAWGRRGTVTRRRPHAAADAALEEDVPHPAAPLDALHECLATEIQAGPQLLPGRIGAAGCVSDELAVEGRGVCLIPLVELIENTHRIGAMKASSQVPRSRGNCCILNRRARKPSCPDRMRTMQRATVSRCVSSSTS
jgi:hypothetical protein